MTIPASIYMRVGDETPASPETNQLLVFFDDAGKMYISFDGSTAEVYTTEDPPSGGGWAVGATPPVSPSDGDGWYNTGDNILYVYDGSRSKWLSSSDVVVTLARNGLINNGTYAYSGLVKNSSCAGATFPRDATLCGMYIKTRNATATFAFSYEINLSNEWSDTISSAGEYSDDTLDTDLDEGDRANIYFSGSDTQRDAVCHLVFRWRYTP